jgi:hypothetical protein
VVSTPNSNLTSNRARGGCSRCHERRGRHQTAGFDAQRKSQGRELGVRDRWPTQKPASSFAVTGPDLEMILESGSRQPPRDLLGPESPERAPGMTLATAMPTHSSPTYHISYQVKLATMTRPNPNPSVSHLSASELPGILVEDLNRDWWAVAATG